ncbi:CDP-diacylglycerol--glycerol-3-phosphate 3-phosphatidyltransferase [Hydrogenovibrio thermophilus]|uniref:CDP-diacylglycerol--glycerol-3-phosphate 3-phosphatidyltransferase n=1 Tax=Hydrogenovibrio thermophilus TaxID=265883 RepID=A0A410H336_9GAMM|nr:CDP-diacylglycerol--glycerol-3-phosphate 3-phosphatidyltransferase [Hydrogenovibrio thermophilus]QAB15321.1 CDP-diacylglycerol--glycerol-3-phosphate 3-phosphatidyltransferase [Hydrogenovibrio thermophilus]
MSLQSLPMMMTWSRVLLIPVFLICYYAPIEDARFWAGLAFMIAAITDWFDGFLARKLNVSSKLGAFLDPVADKLIVAAALIVVAVEYQNIWVTLSAIVIMMREVSISALREWMAENNAREVVAVSNLGKVKTASQLAALTWLLYGGELWGVDWGTLGFPMLYFAAILTIITWYQYGRAALPVILDTSSEDAKDSH